MNRGAPEQPLGWVDTALAKYAPLPRILYFDVFDRGFSGWTTLVGNYEHTLDSMHPGYAQHTPPMLSTLPQWESGSHGALSGAYALKIATRARSGARNAVIKRMTYREAGRICVECFFTFKPEATKLRLSETDFGSFGVLLDVQSPDCGGRRVMPHIRFRNADGERHIQQWQFKAEAPTIVALGTENKTVTHDHLGPTGWEDLPGGEQKLCYNEVATKVNWHYLRLGFDLGTMRYTELRCNDRAFDVAHLRSIEMPAMRNLWCMLNLVFFAEANADKRAFFYLDSVLLSAEA